MPSSLDKLIDLAIAEDIGSGDITTDAIISKDATGTAVIKAKQDLILAGLKVAERVFERIDPGLDWRPVCEDGDRVEEDQLIAEVKGSISSMLMVERIALNFLQHLSGIATFTNLFTESIKGTNTKILDTRKTKPGYRELEKEAVRLGDGENHRMGLYDRYLIKDNHISAAGSIAEAIARVKKNQKKGVLIEVEVKDLSELKEALSFDVDIVMLDNFSSEKIKEAVSFAKGKAKLEASGNITLNNIQEYANTGVDFISIGAITHSAPSADISMLIL